MADVTFVCTQDRCWYRWTVDVPEKNVRAFTLQLRCPRCSSVEKGLIGSEVLKLRALVEAIRRANKPGNPGVLLPGGIVLVDEPAHCNVTTFADRGEALLVFNARAGAENIGQVIIGLTGNQVLQLIQRLQQHADACGRAVAEGRGGARFPDQAP